MAIIVDNLDDAIASFAKAGFVEAMRVSVPEQNVTAVFIDAVEAYGHFIELYEPKSALNVVSTVDSRNFDTG